MTDETMVAFRGKTPIMVYVVGATAALAGLLFGLDIGVISGALPFISKQFSCGTGTSEMIVSSLLAGAVAGTFLSGPISRRWGRKKALLASAVVFVVGSLLSSLATSAHVLIGVRFFLGVAVGMASFTAPLYLSEMSPPHVRGAMISMYQLMITIGILCAFLSDTALSYGGHWRWMLGALVLPASGMFLGICMLPESPRWLALVGRTDEARRVLGRLRGGGEEVEAELGDINEALKVKRNGFQLLGNSNFRRVLLLGVGLQLVQQFTGINIMMYYAPTIFKIAGFATTQEQMFGTVAIGLTNVLATFIAIAFVDKFGRKPILLCGFVVMSVGLLMVGALLRDLAVPIVHGSAVPVHHTVIHVARTTGEFSTIPAGFAKFAAVGFLILFITGFAMSAGPIIWVLCSEIYPLSGRDFGVTTSTATNWFANMVVGATFLTMLDKFGNAQTFWLFGVLNVGFIFFIIFFSPETKGVSLERIEENLMSGKPLRRIGGS